MRASISTAAFAVTLAMATGAGCASAGSSSREGSTANRDVILLQEISARASDAVNALQVIQKLRPQMLRSRGLASPTDVTGESVRPRVYVDNISYGDLSTLENVMANQVSEIRFVNSRDATTQWGTGHMGGVIHVLTRKR